MKTRAKILLGMVVVLAMMVIFAAPAMAQEAEGADAVSTSADKITVSTDNEDSYTFLENISASATTLKVTASGGAEPYTYQWYKDGVIDEWNKSNELSMYPTPNIAGTYKCLVIDANGNKGESKPISITIKPSPHIFIKEAAYHNNSKPTPWNGSVHVDKNKMNEDLTLTLGTTLLKPASLKWYKVSATDYSDRTELTDFQDKDFITLKGGEYASADRYLVQASYDDEPYKGYGYTTSYSFWIYEADGKLEGGILTSTDASFAGVTNKDLTYKITLPAGEDFKADPGTYINVVNYNSNVNWEDYSGDEYDRARMPLFYVHGLNIVNYAPSFGINYSLNLTITAATSNAPATMTFNFAGLEPYSYPLDYEASGQSSGVFGIEVNTKSGNLIHLPTDKNVGYKFFDNDQDEKQAPTASLYTMNPAETDYTGQAQEPTITPNTGAGSVKAVHYYAKDSGTELEGKPTDAGEYTVKIDTNPSNTYNAATNLTLGTYKIKQVTLTDDNAKNFFDFSPKSAVYDAKDQTTTVSLKSGFTKAGAVDQVTCKQNGQVVEPKEPGDYEVYFTTKMDDDHPDDNIKATTQPVKIGTFTITEKSSGGGSSTKTEPTKALYTMDPVKAEYDGKTHKSTITPKSGAGEVDKVRYYLDGKAITGEPKDAGIYTVKIDTKENDTYVAKKELELGTFEITKGKPTKELYTMTPAEAEVSDQAQKPTITPAEGAGEVEKVHYYLDGKEITGEPKDVGTYVVKIDTKENDNYKAEKELEIGNFIIKEKAPDQAVAYSAHVQNVDWQPYVTNGTMAGTVDRSLRMEAVKINLQHQKYKGDIEYRSHIENIGWEKEWKKNDTMSGTNSKGLRLEAMQVRLTGEMAEHYDVYYRVHAQNIGWMNWAKNGEQAGTAGYGYRLEAMQIMLVDKDGAVPNIAPNAQTDKRFTEKYKDNVKEDSLVVYQTHVQNVGWQDYSVDGSDAGTDHQSLRLEGVKMYLNNPKYDGDIEYRTHIENIGWENEWKKNNAMSGTSGRSLRLEAMQVRLTGEMAKHYDVYYRVHAQNIGWMNWAKNGEQAGTAGYAYRLEAMQVVLVEKDGAAPALAPNPDTDQAFAQKQ